MKKKLSVKATAILVVLAMIVSALIWLACLFLDDSRIPKLYLNGDISGMELKTDVRNISFEYKADGERISGYAEIKVQGTSSLAYAKKNYTIKFYQDSEHEEKLEIDLGWGAQSKYCLKANWIDRTHARNVVTAKLVTQVQQKYNVLSEAPRNGAVDGFPVEVYRNGIFLGIYTFNIPKDEWQFGMDGDNPNHIVICGEEWEPTNLFEDMPDFTNWAVEVGEESDETLEKMNALFDFVINSTDEEFKANFEDHLDLDAALNYYVLADFAYLQDNLGKNMLIATYDGAKWYLSLYDLDTSWGSQWDGKSLVPYTEKTVEMSRSNLFARMETCFSQELAERYFELRQDILTKEHVMAEFEAFEARIPGTSWFLEGLRWGDGLLRNMEDIPGYDISQIEEYLDTVIDDLDAKYTAMLAE